MNFEKQYKIRNTNINKIPYDAFGEFIVFGTWVQNPILVELWNVPMTSHCGQPTEM